MERTQLTSVDPASLRFSYKSHANDPIIEPYTTMNGTPAERVLRGTVRIDWDTPDGSTFTLMRAVEHEPSDDTLDELRASFAIDIGYAYDKTRGRGS